MSRLTFLLAIVYFLLVEIVLIMYSPQGNTFFWPAPAAPAIKRASGHLPKAPDYSGETITYDVKMGALKIGTSTFRHEGQEKYNDNDVQVVVFATRVVKLNDTETIWADSKSFLPVRVKRDIRMWPKYEQIEEVYDQARSTLDITKTVGARKYDQRIVKDGPIHNAILLPYQVRRVAELAPGWSIKVTLPTQEFRITLARIEDVEVPAGTFKSYYFESDPRRFEIWITADERRIPVKIKGSSGFNYMMLMSSYSK
ncbi:MAG TPA: DUF3108 domain-containing protein [Candidatus Omnitrophota bacterium]|nr:DUF3108 domain-containing protein [Candidatus Omnitrophota bacterium]